MSNLEKYLRVGKDYSLPRTMKALLLSGKGEQNLKLTTLEVPKCGDNQLLARVDSAIVCASDNKLIDQGGDHALMYGWDVSKYPVTIGHEGSVTLVKVGNNLKSRYRVGQRFAIQPAIPTGPRYYEERYRDHAKNISKIAVGYTLPGLFAEYVLLSEEVIDAGCLLPFPSEMIPYFGAALAEPISCVIASQERMLHVLKDSPTAPRRAEIGPKKKGVTLIVGAGPMGLIHIEVAMSYSPKKIIVSELLETRLKKAREIFWEKAKRLGISLICTDPSRLEEVIRKETDGRGVDDVIVALGIAKVQEKSFDYLTPGGVTNFFGGTPHNERIIQLDTHRIHYDSVSVVGSSGSDPSDVARVLDMMAEGLIDPGNYVMKCGGMDATMSLVAAVRKHEIEGKGVIYPHAERPLFDVENWNLQKERTFLEEALVSI